MDGLVAGLLATRRYVSYVLQMPSLRTVWGLRWVPRGISSVTETMLRLINGGLSPATGNFDFEQ